MSKKLSKDFIKNKLLERGIIPKEEYKNTSTPMKVQCEKDGYEWNINIEHFLYNDRGCPKCNGGIKKTHEQFVEEMKLKNMKVIGRYTGSRVKVEVECINGHRRFIIPVKVLTNKSNCQRCEMEKMCQKNKLVYSEVIDRLKNKKFKLKSKYDGVVHKAQWECDICLNTWYATFQSIFQGSGCPNCQHKSENRCLELIKEIIKYDNLYTHKYIKTENTNFNVDFYLEMGDKKLIIERNGEQHYEVVSFGGNKKVAEEDFYKRIQRDILLEDYCKANNITFFIVPYWWKEEEIVKNLKELNDEWTAASLTV